MSDEGLGKIRITAGRLEIEPVDEEAERIVREAKEAGRKVKVLTESEAECPIDPDVPDPLTMCAALEDLRAAREGEMDLVDVLDRMTTREVLRERWARGELDERDLWRLSDD